MSNESFSGFFAAAAFGDPPRDSPAKDRSTANLIAT
jgi:hypothetical protein